MKTVRESVLEYWSKWIEVTEEEFEYNYTDDEEKWAVVFDQDTNKPKFYKRIRD